MSFEVDRYSSAWAHIALCADLTWATEPPDEFIIANQVDAFGLNIVVFPKYCKTRQQTRKPHSRIINVNKQAKKRSTSSQSQENGSCSRKSVKDVIPESRLAQFYGNFYYDEAREKSYTNANEKSSGRGYNGQGCENSDLTECWMLPEVEYWFRKLLDDAPERACPRRRRPYRPPEDDLGAAGAGAGEEAALTARVLSVRALWAPRAPSPPPAPRKMRARRRQPRPAHQAHIAHPAPPYCIDAPAVLLCDPACKRAIGRLSASVQAVMRASAARCPPYRGTNVSRYAPTSQRPSRTPDRRYGVWWPRDHPSPKLEHRFQLTHLRQTTDKKTENTKPEEEHSEPAEPEPPPEEPAPKEKVVDDQAPTTSAAAIEGLRKKRLYSTVLSMSAPSPINLGTVGCVRLSQKLVTPGLLKLNPKIVLPAARIRPPVENKFEELEKEALEQYKASDESIDTTFRELEKQAVEQYSTSNSNTSCSSGNSAEKKPSTSPIPENDPKKPPAKFHKEKAVDSVVIYSQNFPDLNANKGHTASVTNLKNFHTPPRGEKKEQTHRPSKLRGLKSESQRAASDTDYEARESSKSHKGPMRWTLHVVPPKKRHLTLCVSDFSSDEDMDENTGSIKDAGPCIKNHLAGK
ncbi:hypothetical protein MSG28_013654, partial [Choristoneura fumiferana]